MLTANMSTLSAISDSRIRDLCARVVKAGEQDFQAAISDLENAIELFLEVRTSGENRRGDA